MIFKILLLCTLLAASFGLLGYIFFADLTWSPESVLILVGLGCLAGATHLLIDDLREENEANDH